jgi:hypothetical protein
MISKLRFAAFSSILLPIYLSFNVAAQESKPSIPHILPGKGIADPFDKTGFFPNTSGGIDALNLATGKVLWSSQKANVPLLTTPKYLFALKGNGNQLRVIKLDTEKQGKLLFESLPIPLPTWASVETVYRRSFRSSVRSNSNGLFLIWEAKAFYEGGIQPPPGVIEKERKEKTGVERIDSNTGKIESLDIKKIAAGKFFPMSEIAANPTIGTLTLLVKDSSDNNPIKSWENRRTLQAVNKAKQVIWQHSIASPVQLRPLP